MQFWIAWKKERFMKNIFLPDFYLFLLLLFILVQVISCTSTEEQAVTVAAASNTRYVIEDLARKFSAAHSREVKLIFGSSGRLAAQALNDGPYDLFISADNEYPEYLFSKGIGIKAPELYAKGRLAFVSFQPLAVTQMEMILSTINTFALAEPSRAPYGRATLETLEYYGKKKEDFSLLYGSNVSEAAHFLLTGVDYAFLPLSFLSTPDFTAFFEDVPSHYILVPENAHDPLSQGMLLISERGREFYSYVLSREARDLWEQNGYEAEGG
jgi:molybdate transport system substrate-binding protein